MTVQRTKSFGYIKKKAKQIVLILDEKRKENIVDDKYTQIFFSDNNSEINIEKSRLIVLG
jgi:hypothetical protein